jgi:hypothetical protein
MAIAATNSPHLTWTNIIMTLGFLAAMAGALWTLLQSQRENDRAYVTSQIAASNERDNLRTAEIIRGAERSRDERMGMKEELKILREAIDAHRLIYVQTSEYREQARRLDERLDLISKQLQVLESTRPTTGELQAANRNSEAAMARQEERIRALEQYLLGPRKQ